MELYNLAVVSCDHVGDNKGCTQTAHFRADFSACVVAFGSEAKSHFESLGWWIGVDPAVCLCPQHSTTPRPKTAVGDRCFVVKHDSGNRHAARVVKVTKTLIHVVEGGRPSVTLRFKGGLLVVSGEGVSARTSLVREDGTRIES